MAEYRITAYSNETQTDYYYFIWKPGPLGGNELSEKGNGSYTIPVPDLTGCVIKSITVVAEVKRTDAHGGYGNFTLKLDNTTLGSWSESETSVWTANNLSINGGKGKIISVDLKASNIARGSYTETGNYVGTSGKNLGRATATIVVEADFTETAISPIDGEHISSYLENEFSWSETIISGNVQTKKLCWKYLADTSYNVINLNIDAESYVFPSETFNNGTINWYVEAKDSGGNVANSGTQTVYVGITPTVEISYPYNVNIRNVNEQIFTWQISESIRTGQKSYEIGYKKESESNWTTITQTSQNQYHTFSPDTFSTSQYNWRLKITNNDGISTNYVYAKFVSIGTTSGPDITEITNSSIPTITWENDSQDTFELEIYSGTKRLYTSGIQVGSDVREFTPNLMLEDGNYIVKMRVMNEYGYFSDWVDYSFVLNPLKPTAASCFAYANYYHGASITKLIQASSLESGMDEGEELLGSSVAPTATYVLRRIEGSKDWEIIGTIEDKAFTDNTLITDIVYEYAVRQYAEGAGYSDSDSVKLSIHYDGCIIYKKNSFVQLTKSEDVQFDISHKSGRSMSYSHTIGRKYPVRESSEWMTHSTELSCFVTFEQFELLEQFYESNDDLWFKEKNFSFKCAIDDLSISETLWGKGYTIKLVVSRTDENEVELI